MGLNFLRNVECMMFRSLTHFDAFWGFGGNAHCLPIRVGRSRNLVEVSVARYCFWKAIASYFLTWTFQLTFDSPRRWPGWSPTQCFTILFLGTKFPKFIYWARWTTGPMLIPCIPRVTFPKKKRHGVWPNASLSSKQYFFLPVRIYQSIWSTSQVWNMFVNMYRAKETFHTMLHKVLQLLEVVNRNLNILWNNQDESVPEKQKNKQRDSRETCLDARQFQLRCSE